jgi:hypothetical protein
MKFPTQSVLLRSLVFNRFEFLLPRSGGSAIVKHPSMSLALSAHPKCRTDVCFQAKADTEQLSENVR